MPRGFGWIKGTYVLSVRVFKIKFVLYLQDTNESLAALSLRGD